MVLSIRTNISALSSHKNLKKTDGRMTSSLERMATGLRINKAADDSSGMVIADSLRAQANGLGQAIRNANDAISIVQVADAALEESISIMNRIKAKSIQAAQDGQTTESRVAIQSDINRLLQELDEIANTTSFNGQKLLSGSFTGKAFQIGAYSGERINLTIDSAASGKIGHLSSGNLVLEAGKEGQAYLGIKGGDSNDYTEIQPVDLAWDNSSEHGLGALADAINQVSDLTGVSADAIVISQTESRIQAGMTDTDFSINGVSIGSFSVQANDADGSLVKAINQKTPQHGVFAAVNEDGGLVLSASDGRGILVEPLPGRGEGIDIILGGKDLSTFGTIKIQGQGAGLIDIKDLGGGEPVALADNGLNIKTDSVTSADSVITAGSVLSEGSVLASPWAADQNLTGDRFVDAILIEEQTFMAEGSALGSGSVVYTESSLPDTVMVAARGTTKQASLVREGSLLTTGSILGAGTQLPAGNIVSAGTLFKGDALIGATAPTSAQSLVKMDSVLETGTVIASGSILKGTAVVEAFGPTNGSGIIRPGSSLLAGSVIASGTTLKGVAVIDNIPNTGSTYTLSPGSNLIAGSVIASGTTFRGNSQVNTIAGTNGDATIAGLSTLAANSVIASGTVLTGMATIKATGLTSGEYTLTNGSVLRANSQLGSGTTLANDAVVNSTTLSTGSYYLEAGSTLLANTVLGSGTNVTSTAVINNVGSAGGYTAGATSRLATGSVLGNGTTINGRAVVDTVGPVAGGSVFLAAGTLLTSNSVLASGQSITTTTGTLTAGPTVPLTLGMNYTTSGVNTLSLNNTGVLFAGSELASGSVPGPPGVTLQSPMDVSSDTVLAAGSSLNTGTKLENGSIIGNTTAQLNTDMPLGSAMTLNDNSIIAANSSLASGSVIGTDRATLAGDMNVTNTQILAAGSDLAVNTIMAINSIPGPEDIELAISMPLGAAAMTLRAGSTVEGGSFLRSGTVFSADKATLATDMLVGGASMVLSAGSDIGANSTLNGDSVIGSDGARLLADMPVSNNMILTAGSTIAANSSFEPDTVFANDALTLASAMTLDADMLLSTGSSMGRESSIQYGSYIWADATLISSMTLRDPMTLASNMRLWSDLVLGEGSTFGDNSVLKEGSYVYHPLELLSTMTLHDSIILDRGSEISQSKASLILSGTLVGGDAELAEALVLNSDFNLASGSTIGAESVLRNGSGIGGTVETAFRETVAEDGEMSIGQGSVLARGSLLAAGTFLTSSITGIDGSTYPRGTFLEDDILIEENFVSETMTLAPGSEIGSGSMLHLNADDRFVATQATDMALTTLSDIRVLTQEGAQQAIGLADSAISDLDKIRANLGSTQNQLSSAIAGIATARVNVSASASTIEDIDFAEEAQNLQKMQILAQAGQFALSGTADRISNLVTLLTQTGQK